MWSAIIHGATTIRAEVTHIRQGRSGNYCAAKARKEAVRVIICEHIRKPHAA